MHAECVLSTKHGDTNGARSIRKDGQEAESSTDQRSLNHLACHTQDFESALGKICKTTAVERDCNGLGWQRTLLAARVRGVTLAYQGHLVIFHEPQSFHRRRCA